MKRLLTTSFLFLTGMVFSADNSLHQVSELTEKGLFTDGIEGPACDEHGNVFCVKFGSEHTIGRTAPDGKASLFLHLPAGSTANGIRFGPDGLMYVADYTGHNVLRIHPETKAVEVFAHEPKMNQPNDLAVTNDGTFYASDPNWKEGTGQIWRIDREGRTTRVAENMGTTNGIDVSPDGRTLYVNESVQRKIWAFSIQPDGGLADKRLFKEYPDFGFDGMRLDVKGNLYVTRHGKGTVVMISPKGEELREIALPGKNPSNLCFGGPDGRTVYVTEMEGGQLLQFRVEHPGMEWKRTRDRVSLNQEKRPGRIHLQSAVKDVCAWPNLTLMQDGTLIAVIHNQPAHGTQAGDIECWASANGVRWEKRSTITAHAPGTVRMNHAAGQAANGNLIVLCSGWTDEKQADRPKQEKYRDAILRSWVMHSKNGGRTWEKREVFPAPDTGWTEYIPFGDIWSGKDGALHTSCYQGKLKEPSLSSKIQGYRSWHFRSDDDGVTWKPVAIIGAHHNETQVFPLSGKSWIAAARAEAVDIFRSDDDGLTWQHTTRATARNEINGHISRLANGRLLLSYGVRVPGRMGVCAKFSSDEGKTWGHEIRLVSSFSHDCGYPSSVQLPNGQIVTAYYSKDADEYSGYHMGVAVWEPEVRAKLLSGE